jgi:cystathionine beta-lyase/cystathionine gamma-synthase
MVTRGDHTLFITDTSREEVTRLAHCGKKLYVSAAYHTVRNYETLARRLMEHDI